MKPFYSSRPSQYSAQQLQCILVTAGLWAVHTVFTVDATISRGWTLQGTSPGPLLVLYFMDDRQDHRASP